MPIRPSASADIRQLIEALNGTDEVQRESAVARLAVIGTRAAEQLLAQYPSAAPAARSGMLRALEAIGDARALPLARAALSDPSPETVTAAIGVLRGFLTSPQAVRARDALDAVVATALDSSRPAASRLAALDALRVLPPDVAEAVRKNLSDDKDPDVRARAAAPMTRAAGQNAPATDEAVWREAVAGRLPGSPAPLKHALAARRTSAPLTELQRLVDHLRGREQRESTAERREEWRALRGAVHQALASRNSRLALYDLRDSLLDPDRLPVAFLAAIEEIGDATCLETLAAAYEASSRSGDAWWREHVATAFRAIVVREGLTRRHAAVKRMMSRWPEAAADLMARL
jgi:HEAT repeat protein